MSEIKVNKISPRTRLWYGYIRRNSGDSFVIPAGATITLGTMEQYNLASGATNRFW